MKLIVGLGNPGSKYRGTRHNVGFAVLDELARRRAVGFEASPVDALVTKVRQSDATGFGATTDVLLAKPLTFMNASGEAVGALVRYFKIDLGDLLIVVDEVHLPLGRLRMRARGTAGGHNGLKSIVAHLGEEFPRLRVGVGRGDARRDLADHVLSRFDPEEAADVERVVGRAADAAETFVTGGIEMAMNRFNVSDDVTSDDVTSEEESR